MKYAMSPAGRLSMSGVIRCRNCPLEQHLDRIALSLFSSGDRMATLVHLPSPLAPCKMISLRQIFTLGWPSLSLCSIFPWTLFSTRKKNNNKRRHRTADCRTPLYGKMINFVWIFIIVQQKLLQ